MSICINIFVCYIYVRLCVYVCILRMYLYIYVYIICIYERICIWIFVLCVSLHACMLPMYVIFCQYMYYVCKYKKMSAVYSSTRWSIYPPAHIYVYLYAHLSLFVYYLSVCLVCQTDVCMYVCHVMSSVWMVVLWLLKNPFPKGW